MDNILNSQIIIRSRLEKDDYVKANKVIIKMMTSKAKLITAIITTLLFLLFAALGIADALNETNSVVQYTPSSQRPDVPWYIAYLPTIILLVVFAASVVVIKYRKKDPKRHYESNKLIQQEMQFTFDDMGIEWKQDKGFLKMTWDEVYKVYISRDFFIIFISDRTVWIIPKRNVDDWNLTNLVDIFKKHLDKKKVKTAKF